MMIFIRRVGEGILIGDDVELVVINVGTGNRVKIGIKAPRHINVALSENSALKDEQQAIPIKAKGNK